MATHNLATLDGIAARARELMDQWGLQEWSFRFTRAQSFAGRCRYADTTIELSKPWMEANLGDEDLIEDVILHEIAHALAGAGSKHGPRWKQFCLQVGARPQRCQPRGNIPANKYEAYCLTTGCRNYGVRIASRQRPPVRRSLCGRCIRPVEWRTNTAIT